MKRIKLTVAYDGTNYHGWQIQPNAITVEGELNKVFAECRDIENFNQQKVLEKALLKAFQNEIIKISVVKNSGIK